MLDALRMNLKDGIIKNNMLNIFADTMKRCLDKAEHEKAQRVGAFKLDDVVFEFLCLYRIFLECTSVGPAVLT